MKVTVIPKVIGTRYSHQMIGKGIGRIGNKNTSGDHPNDHTVKIGQNSEKSSEDLGRLGVIQTQA